MIDEIKKLLEQIEQKIDKLKAPQKDEDKKDLFTALAKAQAEFKVAGTNAENPYFKSKYADLREIVMASRPALAKYGLSIIQQIKYTDEGQMIMHTMLCHSSGQWIESKIRVIPPKNDMQTLGSTLSYLRRYSLAALLGIVTGDEDDDGEIAMIPTREMTSKGTALNNKYHPKNEPMETITKEQLEELDYELTDYPDIAENVLDGLKLQHLGDMPKSKFLTAIKRVREIKALREGK